jgi:hypothetical protein
VALCEQGAAAQAGASVVARYNVTGRAGRVLMPSALDEGDQP